MADIKEIIALIKTQQDAVVVGDGVGYIQGLLTHPKVLTEGEAAKIETLNQPEGESRKIVINQTCDHSLQVDVAQRDDEYAYKITATISDVGGDKELFGV